MSVEKSNSKHDARFEQKENAPSEFYCCLCMDICIYTYACLSVTLSVCI